MMSDAFALLWANSSFLAIGFVNNLLVTALAMIVGTVIGAGLGQLRYRGGVSGKLADLVSRCLGSLLAYLVMFGVCLWLMSQAGWAEKPSGLAAGLWTAAALSVPVTGFTSNQFLGFRRELRTGASGTDLVFFSAWVQFGLVVLTVSAIGSAFGLQELSARTWQIVAISTNPAVPWVIYGAVVAAFVCIACLVGRLSACLVKRSLVFRDKEVRDVPARRRPAYRSPWQDHPGA